MWPSSLIGQLLRPPFDEGVHAQSGQAAWSAPSVLWGCMQPVCVCLCVCVCVCALILVIVLNKMHSQVRQLGQLLQFFGGARSLCVFVRVQLMLVIVLTKTCCRAYIMAIRVGHNHKYTVYGF